jgi:hypothetical protein
VAAVKKYFVRLGGGGEVHNLKLAIIHGTALRLARSFKRFGKKKFVKMWGKRVVT